MKITENQMFDYLFCPALFEMKHIRKIDIEESKSMNSLLSKVTNYFYGTLLNNEPCSLDMLKKRWDKICSKNDDYIDAKKNLAGFGFIVNFHNYASEEKMLVLDTNMGYSITSNNVELIGSCPTPIVTNAKRKTELLFTDFGSKVPDSLELDMNLKATIGALAYKKRYDKDIDGIKTFYAKKASIHTTSRNEVDFKRLYTTIDSVGRAIKENIYYPRENVLCGTCKARQYCKYWHREQ